MVLEEVKECGSALEDAAETLRNDKEVVLTAVSEFAHAFQFASESTRNNKEVAPVAVNKYGLTVRRRLPNPRRFESTIS